jgi:hypothetical protein
MWLCAASPMRPEQLLSLGLLLGGSLLAGAFQPVGAEPWKECAFNDQPIPCRDSLGGLWEREIFPQGNAVFTNKANGNRILVPLR